MARNPFDDAVADDKFAEAGGLFERAAVLKGNRIKDPFAEKQAAEGEDLFAAADGIFEAATTSSEDADSPIEEAFWDEVQRQGLPAFEGLVRQHKVGRFYADFALPQYHISIELDGWKHHQSSFMADMRRQRFFQINGWVVIRFAGKEITDDVERCVGEAARLIVKWVLIRKKADQ